MNKKRIRVVGGIALGILIAWAVLCQVVIKQAENYSPGYDVACTETVKRAIHIPSGAVHVFSSCVPPGWVTF